MEKETKERFQKIEKKYSNLKFIVFGFIGLALVIAFGFAFKPKETVNLIRTRGIVIEDEKGKDRILIGAPIPYSKNRVRTDTNLVKNYWASNFPNSHQYMQWYKKYKHTANGMVVMNEKGFDIVLLGDDLADPNIGKRMYKSSGILWNTQDGWERGGAGVNTTEDGKSRPTIGLDDETGEAIHLICLEDGSKGFIIGGENGSLRIGMAKQNGDLFQNKNAFTGIKYFDSKGDLIWEQDMVNRPVTKVK